MKLNGAFGCETTVGGLRYDKILRGRGTDPGVGGLGPRRHTARMWPFVHEEFTITTYGLSKTCVSPPPPTPRNSRQVASKTPVVYSCKIPKTFRKKNWVPTPFQLHSSSHLEEGALEAVQGGEQAVVQELGPRP